MALKRDDVIRKMLKDAPSLDQPSVKAQLEILLPPEFVWFVTTTQLDPSSDAPDAVLDGLGIDSKNRIVALTAFKDQVEVSLRRASNLTSILLRASAIHLKVDLVYGNSYFRITIERGDRQLPDLLQIVEWISNNLG